MSNLIQPNALQVYDFSAWPSDSIKLVLLNSGYNYTTAHHNLSDVNTGLYAVATSANLLGLANLLGVLSADNYLFSALTGSTVTQAWLYLDTGTPSTSTLLVYINQGIGLPLSPDGSDVEVEWMPAGIASL